jgi:hypothetical protein
MLEKAVVHDRDQLSVLRAEKENNASIQARLIAISHASLEATHLGPGDYIGLDTDRVVATPYHPVH